MGAGPLWRTRTPPLTPLSPRMMADAPPPGGGKGPPDGDDEPPPSLLSRVSSNLLVRLVVLESLAVLIVWVIAPDHPGPVAQFAWVPALFEGARGGGEPLLTSAQIAETLRRIVGRTNSLEFLVLVPWMLLAIF